MSQFDITKLPTSRQRLNQATATLAFYGAASLGVGIIGYALNSWGMITCAVGATISTGKIVDSYLESARNLKNLELQREKLISELDRDGPPTP